MKQHIIEKILEYKAIAIVRGIYGEDCLNLAKALYKGGIKLLEATFDQKSQQEREKTAETIKLLCREMGDKMLFGAGTVTTPEMVQMAKDAGATFIISPDTCEEVIRATVEAGLVSIPGALTPTEIAQAHRFGADFVKVFPAGNLGVEYVKSVKAPLSHIKMLAVGGVNLETIPQYKKIGVAGFGLSSNIIDKKKVDDGDFAAITALAKKYVTLIKE